MALTKIIIGPNSSGVADVQAVTGSGGTPGGADTDVQFNDGGAFGGESAFTWDKTTNTLSLGAGSSAILDLIGTQYITASGVTFPDGWGDDLKLSATDYPSLWFHASVSDTGAIIGWDRVTKRIGLTEIAAGVVTGKAILFDFTTNAVIPIADNTWSLGDAAHSWATAYLTSIELSHATGNTLTAAGAELFIEGSQLLKVSVAATTYQPLSANLTSWAAITRAAGFDTWVATPSSANLISLVTDETGSGALVFADTPTLVTPVLGTPTSGTLTNCTGLPSIVVANEAADATCFPAFFTAATGELGPKTNANLTFDSTTGALSATSFVGTLTGNADTVTWANEATDTTCFIGFATAASGNLAPKTNVNMTFNSNTGVVTFASAVLTTADINGGTIDGAIVGGTSAAAGTFTTLAATTIELGAGATDTTLARSSAGNVTIEGNLIYRVGGTDVAVADGGTGASTLTGLLQGNGTSAFTTVTDSSTVGQVLRVTGAATYAWGALDLADTDAITGDLPFANLTQGSALSVLGVTGNATADNASIAAGTDHQVLRRSGTALEFGAVNLAQAAAVTGTLPVGNGGTGITALGTGVATALGVNVGSAGAFVTFNGALGTPSSGTVTNLTGTASININGTVGATTPAAGTFTTAAATTLELGAGATDTTLARSGAGDVTIEGNLIYRVGGTDVALADGGTGASLSDPNIDLVMGWDDSAGAVKFMTLTDLNTEATPADGDFVLMYDAAGNLLKTDWANLPGAGSGIPTIGSSTDNAVVRWNGTGGNAVEDSAVTISDTTGNMIIGPGGNPIGAAFNLNSDGNVYNGVTQVSWSASQWGLGFGGALSRNATPGSHTVVQDGDILSYYAAFGSDGSAFKAGGEIYFYVDGTPATNSVPGRIAFTTRLDGATGVPDERMTIRNDGKVGIGVTDPARQLHVELDSSATNTVTYVERLTSTSSGSPAAGIGVGLEFEVETAAGNNEVGATIEAVTTDVTSTSEDFDLVLKTMAAGAAAAERVRVGLGLQIGSPTGGDKGAGTLNAAGTIYQNNAPVLLNVVEDTTPQLGGNLDGNGFNISLDTTNSLTIGTSEIVEEDHGAGDLLAITSVAGGGALEIYAGHVDCHRNAAPEFGFYDDSTSHTGANMFITCFMLDSAAAQSYSGWIEQGNTDNTSGSIDGYCDVYTRVANTDTKQLRLSDIVHTERALAEKVVVLTDGATPALNAALGNVFTLTAAGDRTIAVPSNATSGQKIIIAHTASGANRTLSLNTGAGGFRFGTDITGLTITTSGLTDYIGCIYNASASRWDVIAYTKGF